MTHFAKLDENNIVTFVTRGRAEDDGLENELSARTGDLYKQTSYNTRGGIHTLGGTPFRKNFAGIGYTYDEIRDAFIPPQTFPSWVLDEESCQWVAPKPMPTNGVWWWDEQQQDWVPSE